jgi:hypothetical protein
VRSDSRSKPRLSLRRIGGCRPARRRGCTSPTALIGYRSPVNDRRRCRKAAPTRLHAGCRGLTGTTTSSPGPGRTFWLARKVSTRWAAKRNDSPLPENESFDPPRTYWIWVPTPRSLLTILVESARARLRVATSPNQLLATGRILSHVGRRRQPLAAPLRSRPRLPAVRRSSSLAWLGSGLFL